MPKRSLLWGLALAVVVGLVVGAWAQEAQEEAAGPEGEAATTVADESSEQATGGLYFHPLGLAYLAAVAILWFLIWDWVHRDCGTLDLVTTVWGLLIWSTGFLHFLLFLVLPNVFLGAGVGLLMFALAVGAYVWVRNGRVPENQRVMTPYHLGLLFRRVMYQFGVVMAPPEVRKTDDRGGVPAILQQHDGVVRDDLREGRAEGEAITAVKGMLGEAVAFRASDVHLEPRADQMGVRYRIDGMLHSYSPFPTEVGGAIVNAIKVLAGMDIATHRRPQDGSFSAQFPTLSKDVDFRVSTTPSVHGETMVIRVLDRVRAFLRIEQLGMSERMVTQVTRPVSYTHLRAHET